VIHIGADTKDTAWLRPQDPRDSRPNLFILAGPRQELDTLDPRVCSAAADYIIEPWQAEEFLLRLSLARQKSCGVPVTPQPAAVPANRRSIGTPKVVLADDDAIIRKVAQTVLGNHSISCKLADRGDEALRLIREDVPHAAVLDVGMPGLDGYEVLQAIRAEGLPVQVILLTSRNEERDILRAFPLGADDYIVKPFKPSELVARLNRLRR
jgi:CheY-like chemotaxis protein